MECVWTDECHDVERVSCGNGVQPLKLAFTKICTSLMFLMYNKIAMHTPTK